MVQQTESLVWCAMHEAKPVSLHLLRFHEALKAIVSADPEEARLRPKSGNPLSENEKPASIKNQSSAEARLAAPVTRTLGNLCTSVAIWV